MTPEQRRDYYRKWSEKNRDRLQESQKAYHEKRKNDPAWRKRKIESNRRYREKHRERERAWSEAYRKIKERRPCENCGKNGLIHKHHPDPKKPLKIVFLCPACHRAEHLKPC